MDQCTEKQDAQPRRALPYATVEEGGGEVRLQRRSLPEQRLRVNACGSHVVHRLYRLKNNDMSLPDYYQYMKSIKDQTNVGYDLIVAEFVNKWL